jgi:U3 small nucleolar RNA-associated protein 20
MVRVRKEFP